MNKLVSTAVISKCKGYENNNQYDDLAVEFAIVAVTFSWDSIIMILVLCTWVCEWGYHMKNKRSLFPPFCLGEAYDLTEDKSPNLYWAYSKLYVYADKEEIDMVIMIVQKLCPKLLGAPKLL